MSISEIRQSGKQTGNLSQFPEMSTERCRLRQVLPEDKPEIFRGLSNPIVTEFMSVHYSSLDETEKQMEFYRNHWMFQTGIFWAIDLKDSNSLAGVIGIYDINPRHNSAEWGFWLLPEFKGKGIIGEIGQPVLDYAFKNLSLNRIHAEVESGNIDSIKVIQKFKFVHEGTLRQREKNRKGRFIDLMIFSKLKSDG